MNVFINHSHQITIRYDGNLITDDMIDAAWFRRPSLFSYERDDMAERMSLEQNARSAFEAIWDAVSSGKWLNSPDAIQRSQRKLHQFAIAQSLGFRLPGVNMTNSWDSVRGMGKDLIFKLPGNGFLQSNRHDARLMFSTRLDATKINNIRHTQPFPGMIEPYIAKKREWRVTVVGEEVFPVAIHTSDYAKDDWRRHQGTANVEFVSEPLPDTSIPAKCKELLYRLGLRYGAFDFIETPSDEMIFLEVNPNGQYMWLEKTLGLPISDAIARELIRIASK
jgi:glutathione synthase/RimK-type ligase-like ATP-grasp enzyme